MNAENREATELLKALAQEIAGRYATIATIAPDSELNDSSLMVPLSLAVMSSGKCFVVEVLVNHLANVLNELGEAAAKENLVDVQFWIQRRKARTDPHPEIWGATIDVDVRVPDPFGSFLDAGLPMPTAWWPTRNGSKAAFVFDKAVDIATFESFAMQHTLALPGGDPNSWSPDQAQHLPIGKKTTDQGLVEVELPATQTNPRPIAIGEFIAGLPARLERALASGGQLTPGERQQVEAYLEELGTPPPADPGGRSGPFDRCPTSTQHDRPCCYVLAADDGSIRMTCYGGHAGAGEQRWPAVALYELATGTQIADSGIVPLRDVPATWAGMEYAKQRFTAVFADEKASSALLEAALTVLVRAKAASKIKAIRRFAEQRDAPITNPMSVEELARFYRRRVEGFDATGACRVAFDAGIGGLHILSSDGSMTPIKTKAEALSVTAHRHEWHATLGYDLCAEVTEHKKTHDRSITLRLKYDTWNYNSHWNKAMQGTKAHLAALGVPMLYNYVFPIAFVKDDCTIDATTKCLTITRAARTRAVDPTFDSVEFLSDLQRNGKLPLATEEDVLRYLMAIASPLIRLVTPGLLGVYVFVGPSGSGKEYMIALIKRLWERAITTSTFASFEMHDVDDLEQNRNFYAASQSAVYLHAAEAGKSIDKINALIRYSTAPHVTARGMHLEPRPVKNVFTFLADAVEGLPDRREVSRRTVEIGTHHINEDVSKGEVAQTLLENAANIIVDLKRRVDVKSPEWFSNQSQTKSRPVGQVALANLLGAPLSEVAGADLAEFYDYVIAYKQQFGEEEGRDQLKSARDKDAQIVKTFPSYRLTHFIDSMAQMPGAKQFFKAHDSARRLQMYLRREANYDDVASGRCGYLRWVVGGTPYAFRLVKGERNFVCEPEMPFCNKLGIEPLAPSSDAQPVTSHERATRIPPPVATPAVVAPRGPARVSAGALRARGRSDKRE